MPTRVVLSTEAQHLLRTLPPQVKRRMRAALSELKRAWPTPQGLDLKRLRSDPTGPPVFRLRMGNWRAVFRARGDVLEVVRVFHRREGYGWMERA